MRTGAAISCFLLIFNRVCCQSGSEEYWVDPYPQWAGLGDDINNQPHTSCECPAASERSLEAVNDAMALTYFKKFVNLLFHRNRLQYDAKLALHRRSLLFSILPTQLEELEKVQDARDLDILVTKILESAKETSTSGQSRWTFPGLSVFSLFKESVALMKTTDVQFILFVTLAAILGSIVYRRYNVRLITIFLSGTFLFGYFHTYMECNREADVEAMIEIIKHQQNPGSSAEMPWYSRLASILSPSSPQDKQIEMLRKSSKVSLSICRPDKVLFMYMNDIFITQLEILIEKLWAVIRKMNSRESFPYNLIAPIILVALVAYIIKLTFKYIISPRAWASLLHNNSAPIAAPMAQQSIGSRDSGEDCLSGDNLKMLLNVMSSTSIPQKTQAVAAVSGVQELVEALEAPTTPEKKNIDESDSSSGSKFNLSENDEFSSGNKSNLSENDGFTLVDDHEDDNIDNL
ncbi:uncharacterized protein LOC108110118 [Drosophila eugracilis]|uniref:uncharacterized protein LOC108110118 n=1 Tax=Drosophila eugracilis TaxID=29029 RepID=UPI0007E877AF|nr:uncharacterized protein LOC108110118 [Drosophila eugracilis]